MTDKTEIEVGAIKLTGGKLLIIVPVLGTIIGGLWGGFELYQRLLDAEAAIVNYVSPDFSSYDEGLAVLSTRLEDQERILNTVEASLRQDIDDLTSQNQRMLNNVNQQIDRIEADVASTEDIARGADDTVAETTRELRDDVYALEERVNDSIRDVNTELRDVREDLEDRIQQILDNPLNDSQ
jgi:gas vesicle protein